MPRWAEAVRVRCVDEAAQKLLDLRKKAEEWKQPNKEEKNRLAEEYGPKLAAAVKQFREAIVVVKGVPGGEEAVKELIILEDKNGKEKESDKGKARFEAQHGAGAVELDALEALHPGELRRIVEAAIDV